MRKIKIEGPDAIGFAKRLREVTGEKNLQVKINVILKCKRGARLSYEQVASIMNDGRYRVRVKKSK